jgi:opacity protein-like surface antigen
MEPMKKFAAAALAGLALASTPSQAADLFGTAAPPMSAPDNPAVEIGTNWYIRGDVGASFDSLPNVTAQGFGVPPTGTVADPISATYSVNSMKTDFTADVGLGYRFNNWFRADVTYDYRSLPGASGTTTVGCPNSLITYDTFPTVNVPTSVTNPSTGQVSTVYEPEVATKPIGYLYNTGTSCNGVVKMNQQSNMGLVTGYVDLGNYWGFTPYVGAGAGMNATYVSGSIVYTNASDGSPYNANLTPPASTAPTILGGGATPLVWLGSNNKPLSPQPTVSFSQQNWNRTISSVKYGVAWALTAGVGYQISPSATIDVSYRYLNTGAPTSLSVDGATMRQQNVSQQVRIGLRYMLN